METYRQREKNAIKQLELTLKIYELRLKHVEDIALEALIKLKENEEEKKILCRQCSCDSLKNSDLDKSFKSLN